MVVANDEVDLPSNSIWAQGVVARDLGEASSTLISGKIAQALSEGIGVVSSIASLTGSIKSTMGRSCPCCSIQDRTEICLEGAV